MQEGVIGMYVVVFGLVLRGSEKLGNLRRRFLNMKGPVNFGLISAKAASTDRPDLSNCLYC